MPLSLSPRYDLFRFALPKDFLPKKIEDKYKHFINKDPNVITSPIDYLNESIQGVNFPGIQDVLIKQQQVSSRLGHIEPHHEQNYISPANPLSQINMEITVAFRINQGLYNYFMLYETLFEKTLKYKENELDEIFTIEILSETGEIVGKLDLFQPRMAGIDGLDFSYNKIERQAETFNVIFAFNNIDFNLINIDEENQETPPITKKPINNPGLPNTSQPNTSQSNNIPDKPTLPNPIKKINTDSGLKSSGYYR